MAVMFGAGLVLALGAVLVLDALTLAPLLLLGALGRVSTLLTLILLLPPACLAELALLRLCYGLPAIALGLRRPLAEGWAISQSQALHCAATWALALAPFAALAAAWVAVRPDPLGWGAAILRPVIDTLLVALTGSVTGLFYRGNRLPAAFRPDRRPSRNRTERREPVFQ